MKIHYESNNSGGDWWLSDEDWYALEKAGWEVEWRDQRWLGTLATCASKECETPGDAMSEFETITGQSVCDEGCNCCGPPHIFDWHNGWAGGERCLEYLYPDNQSVKLSKRELIEGQG